MPFGTCCISLKPVVDPVVSKKGDLFSRDAIVEYLAHQKVVQRQEKSEPDNCTYKGLNRSKFVTTLGAGGGL